jgi:hypothetical protein
VEQVVNHVLTPGWWEKQRQEVAWSAEPARAAQIARFVRERPAPLFRSLATGLHLPPPHVARVDVQGRGWVAVDGRAYRSAYTGHYFADGTIQVAVPPEGRAGFRHFMVNGRLEPGPELRVPVTEDLEIVARFGD